MLNASGHNANGNHPTGPLTPPISPPTHNNNNNHDVDQSAVFVNPIFFPSEQSFQQLVKTLDGAKKSLDICVYTITDDHLANAIIRVGFNTGSLSVVKSAKKSVGSDDPILYVGT